MSNKLRSVQFLSIGALWGINVLIPLIAKDLGIPETEIGLIVICYNLTLFFSSYFFGRASDIYGRRPFLMAGLLLSSVAMLAHLLMADFHSMLVVRILSGLCAGIHPAALMAYVHDARKGIGEYSSFGSLGWGVSSATFGVMATYAALSGIYLISSLFYFGAFVLAVRLERVTFKSVRVPLFPVHILRKNAAPYLGMLIRHSGAFMIWTFWSIYLNELGADIFWIGVIQFTNAFTQFTVMYTLGDRFSSAISVAVGLALSTLTFFTFTLAENFWYIIPTQFLLGTSWAFLYVGAFRYVTDRNPEKASASGLMHSTISLSSILGPILATLIISLDGGFIAIMYVATLMAFTSFVLFMLLERPGLRRCEKTLYPKTP